MAKQHGIDEDKRPREPRDTQPDAKQQAGLKAQKEAATQQPQSPGEPAGGE